MALTEKDLLAKAPVIKKTKTLNPLGAIFYSLVLGGSHTLIYNSFINSKYSIGIGIVGVFLLIIASLFILVASILSTKIVLFTIIIDKSKSISAQIALQIVYFYIGFIPIYGFSIVYFQKTIELWQIFVISLVVVIFYSLIIMFNFRLMKKDKAKISDLKETFYQPMKPLLISLNLLVTIIVTAILFAF